LSEQRTPHAWIVADGGSTDGTAELAERLGAEVVRSARGRGHQLRRGAARAEAEILLFLHADCRPAPGALAAVSAAFEERELVATGMRQSIDHGARFYRWIERAADRRVRAGWVYGDSGLAVRSSAYRAAGGFRELPVFEDLELCSRLRRLGPIRLVPEATLLVSARRWESEGRLRRTLQNWTLTALFAVGVAPERLARHYRPQGS
jgi:rSAM/selenodomain-associated transferase 2